MEKVDFGFIILTDVELHIIVNFCTSFVVKIFRSFGFGFAFGFLDFGFLLIGRIVDSLGFFI